MPQSPTISKQTYYRLKIARMQHRDTLKELTRLLQDYKMYQSYFRASDGSKAKERAQLRYVQSNSRNFYFDSVITLEMRMETNRIKRNHFAELSKKHKKEILELTKQHAECRQKELSEIRNKKIEGLLEVEEKLQNVGIELVEARVHRYNRTPEQMMIRYNIRTKNTSATITVDIKEGLSKAEIEVRPYSNKVTTFKELIKFIKKEEKI